MLRFSPRYPNPPSPEVLQALHPYTGVLAQLLAARGVQDGEAARRFLEPAKEQFHDPFLLHGMGEAVSLLAEAKAQNKAAVVYGDYDVDGMCAAAILTDALRRFGLGADFHIPLREEGYGLNLTAVESLAEKYQLLVTVDLGITNHPEVRHAQALGMEVIVTDHHQLALEESPADAVITPLLNDYPCPRLCGAGVAFKLAQALLGMEPAEEYLDLAALATVADMVPLAGENRVIVALGLPMISAKKREGIRALMEVSGISGPADSGTLGFQLAPRLNAAGRLQDAAKGACLLMTQDAAEADQIAGALNALNTERKKKERDVLAEAETAAQAHDFAEKRALIVKGQGWHLGVVGLAAGRLCRKYACPTAVLSEEEGILHGSLRSVPGVNIHRCLQACDDLLLRYGGHEQAAGVTLALENYEAFCDRLNQAVCEAAGEEAFIPSAAYDLPLPLSQVTQALTQELARLAPFGLENPAPVFLAENVLLARRKACGADGSHLQITLQEKGHMLDGIAFGMGALAAALPDKVDALISLRLDTFRGETRVKCEAEALRPAQGAGKRALLGMEQAEFEAALLLFMEKFAVQAEKTGESQENLEIIKVTALSGTESLPPPCRGVLYVAVTRASALAALEQFPELELCRHTAPDPLCFPTLLLHPRLSSVSGSWRKVILLDGETVAGEAKAWSKALPQAEILVCPQSAALKALAAALDPGDDAFRALYKALRVNAFGSLAQTAKAAGLTPVQTQAGLTAFAQLGLIDYQASPFAYTLLPPAPCKLEDSPILGALRGLARGKEV